MTLPISPDEFDRIERYLRGALSPEERAEFERQLREDPAMEARLKETELIIAGIEEAALEERLPEFHRALRPGAKRVSISWAWAAAACLVLAASIWLFLKREPEERLFADFFEPDPGLVSPMGESEQYHFDHAMVLYKSGKYAQAIQGWKSLLAQQPSADTILYFIGTAYLAQRQADSAVAYLQRVAGSGSSFAGEANWYLGLAWLLKGNYDKAAGVIGQSGHPRKDQLLPKIQH